MLIPAIAVAARAGQLDEPHTSLDHPPGHQAQPAVLPGVGEVVIHAVQRLGRLGLVTEIHQLRHGHLHPRRQLVIRDRAFHLVDSTHPTQQVAVQSLDQRQLRRLQIRLRLPRGDVGHRAVAGLKHRSLEGGRQKPTAEAVKSARGNQTPIEHHVGGQVLALAAQPVGHPGPVGRSPLQTGSGVQKEVRVGVFGERSDHRTDHTQVVGTVLADRRKQRTDRQATLAVLFERPGRLQHLADIVELGRLDLEDPVRILAMEFLQRRLRVEGVDLRGSSIHVEKYDPLGFCRKMSDLRIERSRSSGGRLAGEHRRQGNATEAVSGLHQHFPTGRRRRQEAVAMVHRSRIPDAPEVTAGNRSCEPVAATPGRCQLMKMNSLALNIT